MANNNSNADGLEKIFFSIQKREFKEAEKTLLSVLKKFIDPQFKNIHIKALVSDLYYHFNPKYLQWLKNRGGDIKKEIKDLSSPVHDNFLIAHCSDPACLDDLFKEIEQTFESSLENDKKLKKSIEYHLACYKNLLTKN